MTLVDSHRLDDALAELVAEHVLTPDQALAVTHAVVEQPETRAPSPLRARLTEAAAYLGAVLVGAGILALVSQNWDAMEVAARVGVVVGLGAVSYALGLVIALAVRGGRASLRQYAAAPRRRVASVLLTLGALLMAAGLPVGMDATSGSFFFAALVALALLVPAQVLAPSAVTELALFGATATAVGVGLSLLVPDRPEVGVDAYYDGGYPPARGWDYLVPGALALLGLLWASVVSRVMTLPVVAQVVGLLVTYAAVGGLASDRPTRAVGLVGLALLAVIGVLVFVRERGWPWLVLTVVSTTLGVFILVADTSNTALAFLVSGMVLLASAGGATLLGRRRAHPA